MGERPENREIIETYWNVNDFELSADLAITAEIIETYWNVNEENKIILENRSQREIIETYWNVNQISVKNLMVSSWK